LINSWREAIFRGGRPAATRCNFGLDFSTQKYQSEQKLEKSALCRNAHPSGLGDSPLMKTEIRNSKVVDIIESLGATNGVDEFESTHSQQHLSSDFCNETQSGIQLRL
jgi:hypothetical protein